MDLLAFLAAPFVAGLILTGIHAYLGVHVVERGVIFVDLSLAQIAALSSQTTFGHRYTNVLPSLNLRFYLRDNLFLRFAVAKARWS